MKPDENIPVRSFILGDPWLYYKIYTGPKTADGILTEIIGPLTKSLLDKEIIDKWFFIRYADPDFHLRVRFHAKSVDKLIELILAFNQATAVTRSEGKIWNIQVDTYERELERYGIQNIEPSEAIFFYDSELILGLLNLIDGPEGEEIRWLFGLKAIDSLLNVFGYQTADKHTFTDQMRTRFGLEFNMSRFLKKQLDHKYRNHRNKIDEFMALRPGEANEMEPLISLLSEKEQALSRLKVHPVVSATFHDWVASHIHMLVNRLFRSKNRLHELVLYDFLCRTYKSQIARQKQAKAMLQ